MAEVTVAEMRAAILQFRDALDEDPSEGPEATATERLIDIGDRLRDGQEPSDG